MSNYPFKFLDSYTKENKSFFFGREEEIKQLYEMVFETNMIFVYGPSGAGKTSLLQCGLASKFKQTDWFDLYVRRGDNICESTRQTILKNTIVEEEDDFWDEEDEVNSSVSIEKKQESFTSDQTALMDLYHSTYTPIYFIYDQFEELYTLGTEQEQADFIQLIKDLEAVNVPCTFLFVMREEYLAVLYQFEKAMPYLLKKKLRVEHMGLKKIREVISGVTTSNQSIVTLQGEETEKNTIIDTIFDKVREGRRTLQLPYLQIFMDRVYEKVTGDVEKKRNIPVAFSLSEIQAMDKIEVLLENFLDQQIHSIELELKKKGFESVDDNFVMSVLSPLVTLEGTKEPLHKAVLMAKNDLTNYEPDLISQTLTLLENSRILRYRSDEEVYEVAHDTLAKEIANKRSEEEKAFLRAKRLVTSRFADFKDTQTLLNAQELAYVMPFTSELKLELNEEQQHYITHSKRVKTRKLWLVRSGIGALLIIAGIVVITVLNANRKAQIALKNVEAEQQRVLAAQKRTEVALFKIKEQQAVSKAQELMSFGDGFKDLGKSAYACENYQAGLDTLQLYPNTALYQELETRTKGLCK